VTVWADYQQCDVCGASLGKPCMTFTGFNAASGVHDVEFAAEPHTTRKLRAESARTGGNR
jgi:hypothetical protein